MKKLKAWMAEHKKFSVIALCLLLMFTCGSAMSAINVSHHRAETAKEQHAENNTDTTTAAEKKTKEETGKVELSDAQKEIIKGYDTDTKELIDTLSSSVWSVSEGRYTLKFADDSYVETVNGTPTVHSYAISRVEKTSDGYGGYLYTIVFETDTGTHIVYDVIDGRYKAGKPMVITTNFDFRERILNATADDPWGRVFDRIVEVGFPVKYDGNSRRREIGMKNRKDFKRKLGIEGIES